MSNLYVLYETSLGHYIPFLCSCLFTWSVVSLYLDDFKLHNNIYIKYIQLFCLISIPLYVIYKTYSIWNYVNIITHVKDNDINLHGHVSLNKEAAAEISKGISIIGSNLGLGATIAGIGTAVAKGVAKSSMPPLQKAGLIVSSGLITGVGHSIITNINKYKYSNENISSKTEFSNSSNINKFMDNGSNSPLQNLLFDIEALNYVCLGLMFILIIQIAFKYYFLDNIKLNLSTILGIHINNKLEYYINKTIILNKKMSHIWIWLAIILILIALSFSAYASAELYNNIDGYINLHQSIKNK